MIIVCLILRMENEHANGENRRLSNSAKVSSNWSIYTTYENENCRTRSIAQDGVKSLRKTSSRLCCKKFCKDRQILHRRNFSSQQNGTRVFREEHVSFSSSSFSLTPISAEKVWKFQTKKVALGQNEILAADCESQWLQTRTRVETEIRWNGRVGSRRYLSVRIHWTIGGRARGWKGRREMKARERERERKRRIGRRLVVSLHNDLRALSVLLFPTLRGERESSTTCPTMRTAATPGGGPWPE